MEKELDFVETTYVENVPENADAERIFTELCEKGYKVIFGTTHYMGVMQNVAKKYPDVIFEECTGYETLPNQGTYFGKIEQARYLTGIIAGKMTKTNKIGYVAAHTIPEVIRGLNAFTLGVRKANPKASVHVVWTHSWFDPPKEKEAAQSLLDIGADIIAQHQDSAAAQQAAETKGVYSIGYNSDMSAFAPKSHLTAPIWDWAPFYIKTVKEIHDGTWKSSSYWGDMNDGLVTLAPFNPAVPDDLKKLVEEEKKALMEGKYDVFDGPVKDQKGNLMIKEGQKPKPTDKELLEMNWLVEGVVGEIATGK
jgi:basic membrane protein A